METIDDLYNDVVITLTYVNLEKFFKLIYKT